MSLVRSLLFLLVFYPGSVLFVLAAIAAVPFGEIAIGRACRRWAWWHRLCARFILGVRTRVEGDLPRKGVLYAIKHEAMFETIETLMLFDRPMIVMKQELIDIPGWGYMARKLGVIPVDREAGAAAMRRMIAAAKLAKASNRVVILFPEGTRVPHGERPPLRAGFAGLYKVLGLPVVPVALDSGKVWPKGLIKRAGLVTFKVGATIPPGLSREDAEARVHSAINALSES